MLYKTRGIVLNFIKYRETSIIVRIYTEEFGLTSYIVNGVRSKKSKNKIALFQPLTLLDLVVYNRKNSNLNRISEIKCAAPFAEIPTNIKKSTMALFMTEMLVKTLKGEEGNAQLFDFLYQSILVLEHMHHGYENFHLQFILKLARYLGFAPQSAEEILHQVHGAVAKQTDELQRLDKLLKLSYQEKVEVTNAMRRNLLIKILDFYRLHVDALGEVKSLTVLHAVLN